MLIDSPEIGVVRYSWLDSGTPCHRFNTEGVPELAQHDTEVVCCWQHGHSMVFGPWVDFRQHIAQRGCLQQSGRTKSETRSQEHLEHVSSVAGWLKACRLLGDPLAAARLDIISAHKTLCIGRFKQTVSFESCLSHRRNTFAPLISMLRFH